MQIHILGTAAADGWPATFCACDTCRKVREVGGKNIRSRASIQFGERYKIDIPPDTWYHGMQYGIDLSKLEHVFITHSHDDHFTVDYLQYLRDPFAHCRPGLLTVYGNDAVIKAARDHCGRHEGASFELIEVEPFVPVQAGELTFTPVIANHMPHERALTYVINCEGKTVLYASDTGWYPEESWNFLEGLKLDCIIAECTMGPIGGDEVNPSRGHMNFAALFAMKERLEKARVFVGDVFVTTHFSHNVGLLHEEIENIVNQHGIVTAYDGMTITLQG